MRSKEQAILHGCPQIAHIEELLLQRVQLLVFTDTDSDARELSSTHVCLDRYPFISYLLSLDSMAFNIPGGFLSYLTWEISTTAQLYGVKNEGDSRERKWHRRYSTQMMDGWIKVCMYV